MLSQRDLQHLALTYRQCDVLSVYFTTRSDLDDAGGRAGRVRPWEHVVERELATLREHHVVAPGAERLALETALARFAQWREAHAPEANAPGFVVFASTEGVLHAGAMAVPVRTEAIWQKGAHLAPLVSEVSLGPAAAVLVVDARHAQLFRFQAPGDLEAVDVLEAETPADAERRMGASIGPFHAGTRGGTAADKADRLHLAARHELYDEAVRRADAVSAPEGWIVIAGSARAVAAASAVVPRALAWRTVTVTPFDVHAADPELARAVGRAVTEREAQRDREVVLEILEAHGSRGRGVAGLAATRAAVARDGVATLLLSQRFVEERPADADTLLAEALARGATVRQIGGMAAEEADLRADGVVARLRYRVNDPGVIAPL